MPFFRHEKINKNQRRMIYMEKMIKKAVKPVFIMWLVSILCYLPFIANSLTNSVDGLWASTYYQAGNIELGSGRWALLFLDKGRGGYAAEPFSSFFALFFVCVAVYVVIDMFTEISNMNYIIGLLIPCSTAICCILAYRFTSSHYGLSILLAAGTAWLVTREIEDKNKSRKRMLLAIALLVLCLGIYQANLGCFCVLVIIYMMKLLLESENKKCFALLKRTMIAGVASGILYKIAWEVCLRARHIAASDYNGAGSVSIGSIMLGLPVSIVHVYNVWMSHFFVSGKNNILSPIMVLASVLVFALTIYVGVKGLKNNIKTLVLYVLLFLCLPIGANIALVLAPETNYLVSHMTVPMVMVIPTLLFLLGGIGAISKKIICIVCVLLLYRNVIFVGTNIDALNQGSNTTYAIMNNIVTSLNEERLLGSDYKYAFYGSPSANKLFKVNELYEDASGYAQFGTLLTKPDMVRNAYNGLLDDIGINLESVDYDTYVEILDSETLESMPAYPAEGSIFEKNGIVIVKVSDEYKWK